MQSLVAIIAIVCGAYLVITGGINILTRKLDKQIDNRINRQINKLQHNDR